MKQYFGTAFLASASISSVICLAQLGHAYPERFYDAATQCTFVGGPSPYYANGQVANNNSNSTFNMMLWCSVLYGYQDCNLSNSATVYGYQHNAADTQLSACRTYIAGGGGTCSGPVTPSGKNATYSINLNIGAWNNFGDPVYIYAVLPPPIAGSADVLFGYWVNC